MRSAVAATAACLALLAPSWARAQVAPTEALTPTTSLPDGPGSVRGLADAASVDLFSGQVEYSVPIEVPLAAGLAPQLAIAYSGALGAGPLGIGWKLEVPAIRRSLRDGVPGFDDGDELTIEGLASGRLVPIGGGEYRLEGDPRALRARRVGDRFEVWTADGTRWFLGVTGGARQQDGPGRIAAWYAQHAVDTSGAELDFEYTHERGEIYLRRVTWGPGGVYRVEVELESRPDAVTSLLTGFEVVTARRVRSVRVGAFNEELRRYHLSYDDGGAVSRLVEVRMTGRGGEGELPRVRFGYVAPPAAAAAVVEGAGGWALDLRGVALVDVDGDGAADLLRLEPGYSAWRKNLGGSFGSARALPGAEGLELGQVRFLDVDGDARAELVRLVGDAWRVYDLDEAGVRARGSWPGTLGVPLRGDRTIFADVDGDGRTDVIEAVTGGLRVRFGARLALGPPTTMPRVSAADPGVEPGAPGVRFLELNGDGLVDVAWITDDWMKVFLGRGDGSFVASAKVFYPWGAGGLDAKQVLLHDLNADGLVDLVATTGSKVLYYRGGAGFRFEPLPRLLDRPAGAPADARIAFADADGDGSDDLVWSSQAGMFALDLSGGATAAMVASIDNGLGETTRIHYSSSGQLAIEAAAVGQPWLHRLPRSMPVPVRVDAVYADGTPTRTLRLGVRDGLWDGEERRFAGYLVSRRVLSGERVELMKVSESRYLPGLGEDRALRGLTWHSRIEDGNGQPLTVTESEWRAQALDGLPDDPLLRRAVMLRQQSWSYAPGESPALVQSDFAHDGQGRLVEELHLGRVDRDGDEKRVRHAWAADPAAWIMDLPCEQQTMEVGGAVLTRVRQIYGDDQAEAPLCQPGRGWKLREEAWLDQGGGGGRWVTQSEARYDQEGNLIASYEDGMWRYTTWSDGGLYPVAERVEPAPGEELVWSTEWDTVLGVPVLVTDPSGVAMRAEYDALGRVTALARDGQPAHARFEYQWNAPRPTTISYSFDGPQAALAPMAPGWRESRSVNASTGEPLYQAVRLTDSRWIISGAVERDVRGQVRRRFDAFHWDGDELPTAPPPGTAALLEIDYDAFGRATEMRTATGQRRRLSYGVLCSSEIVDGLAPVSSCEDGLGRLARSQRSVDGVIEAVDAVWDAADRLVEVRQAEGALVSTWSWDSLGRLVRATDPDVGVRLLSYDDAGRVIAHENGAGQLVAFEYDGAGRLTRRFADGVDYRYHYDAPAPGRAEARQRGRLAWIEEPTGRVELGYDAFGRLAEIARVVDGQRAARTITLGVSGLVLEETHGDGLVVPRSYDRAGRLIQIGGYWQATEVDAAGRVLAERFGSGAVNSVGYDAIGQVTSLALSAPGGAPLLSLALTRDVNGLITAVDDSDGAGIDHDAGFSYDSAGRLTAATMAGGYSFSYAYDPLQNLIARTADGPTPVGAMIGDYRYGEDGRGPRQLTSVVSVGSDGTVAIRRLSWDAAGRQIGDERTGVEYDAIDQVVGVDVDGVGHVGYAYGYDGLRTRVLAPGEAPELWFAHDLRERGDVREHWINVGSRLVAKVTLRRPDAGGGEGSAPPWPRPPSWLLPIALALAAALVSLRALGRRRRLALAPLLLAAGCGLLGSARHQSWITEDVVYFHQGVGAGPVLITDEAGAVVEERRHEPYGLPIGAADYQFEPHNELGKPTDPRTGWSYHGARWLAPESARWLTPDPVLKAPSEAMLGTPWRLHPYQYVVGNPISNWDPTGGFDEVVHGWVTYHLALAMGFKQEDAAKLALHTAGVDHNPKTKPTNSANTRPHYSNLLSGKTKHYHFNKGAEKLLFDTMASDPSDLAKIGLYFHGVQDMGAHDVAGPHAIGKTGRARGAVKNTRFGVGHKNYTTEKGNKSKMTNSVTDQVWQNPKHYKKLLLQFAGIIWKMQTQYYGEDRVKGKETSAVSRAEAIVDMVIKADKRDEILKLMDMPGLDSEGNKVMSWAEVVNDAHANPEKYGLDKDTAWTSKHIDITTK